MPACPLPRTAQFSEVFAHPEDPVDFGMPISCLAHFPIVARGQRRNWRYVIAYAKREERHTFTLPCPSLPIEMSRKQTVAIVARSRRQKLRKDHMIELEEIRERTRLVLCNRRDEEEFMPDVDNFLASVPRNDDEKHDSYYCVLSHLSQHYGNDVYKPPEIYVRGILIWTTFHYE
jgi:hypothetical protein